MSEHPIIFIGSSTESLAYANALQRVLDHEFIPTVWTYGVFLPGQTTLDSLFRQARRADFAALFLTPDDESIVRGQYLKTPRDNLVFELGLFIGQMESKRAFLVTPRSGVDLPNDLHGVTPLTYRNDREDQDIQNAINPVATDIREAAKRLGPRAEKTGRTGSGGISVEALAALGRLGATADKVEAELEVRPAGGGRFSIIVLDRTHLGSSVEVDFSDPNSVRAIDELANDIVGQA